jgi:hypothetical protein
LYACERIFPSGDSESSPAVVIVIIWPFTRPQTVTEHAHQVRRLRAVQLIDDRERRDHAVAVSLSAASTLTKPASLLLTISRTFTVRWHASPASPG